GIRDFDVTGGQTCALPIYLVSANPAVTGTETAPMLRGVITRINDRPAREVAGDHWVVRGDRGITYAATPGEKSRITAGQFWPPRSQDRRVGTECRCRRETD